MEKKNLPDIKTQFPEWYQAILEEAELADHSPTRGCMVIRPYGYAIWERIQRVLDEQFKSRGVQNAYFPLLIPESFLKKEAKHVEGFSPELAVVTHAGGKELEEPLVVRPTSETIIYSMFSKWIKSWRDLPLVVNQWANVVRWEMRTRPFLRTSEFLWQEGHTAHATHQEAQKMATEILDLYKKFAYSYLAIPVITGEKSAGERFAGAEVTYTFEGFMQDGKALQMGTSHMLLQSFSQAFDIFFQAQDGSMQSPFCTSWGCSTRLIGALIMVHGDEFGLQMPPMIAPIQAVIIPIFKTDEEKGTVLELAAKVRDNLSENGVRVVLDADERKTPGAKFYHWEVRGVPVRIEVGPKDVEKNQVVLVNRVEKDKSKKKEFVSVNSLNDSLQNLFNRIQKQLFDRATQSRDAMWHKGEKLSEFGPLLENENRIYQTGWCRAAECEAKTKEFKGTIRCLLNSKEVINCFACNKASVSDIVIAKSY